MVLGPTGNMADNNKQTPAEILQANRKALFSRFTEWEPTAFLNAHAAMLDAYFTESFSASRVGPAMAIDKNPHAIVGLGGYGREEQCIHSDVDLLILFEKQVPDEAEELVREYVYPLWDIGLDIGYAIRSLKDCIQIARTDYETLTAMLDARFICGISPVYATLANQLNERITKRFTTKVIRWLMARNRKRHENYGDSTFLLEPNLKEGAGGLRDYHTLLWIGKIHYGIKSFRDFEYLGVLSHDEYAHMGEALSYIWGIRNRLHHLAGRKCDQLYFEYQTKLAEDMELVLEGAQMPVERLMGDLHAKMGYIKKQLLLLLYDLGYEKPSRRSIFFRKRPDVPGIQLDRGGLNFISANRIVEDPVLLIRIFEVSARMRLPLVREATRLVREFLHLVDDAFRRNPEVKKSFEKILMTASTPVNVLEQMLETGFLTALIPEFKGIVDRIQFDAYHLFPMDRHSIRVVQKLKKFSEAGSGAAADELGGGIYRSLKKKHLLLLAALLHDVGKGVPDRRHSEAGAEMAEAVLNRFGYTRREVDLVCFLIRNHLLLVKTATRRDIYDEETAIRMARTVKDIKRLKMLYLITVADSMATGPKAWNDWTATLVRDLFLKVLRILEKGELASTAAVKQAEKKKAFVRKELTIPGLDVEAVLATLTPRYLLYTDSEDIANHIRLYSRLGEASFVWDVQKGETFGTRQVVVCAKDHPGLFSAISGVFTLNGIDILNVQVFTWKNNIALDVFTVTPPPDLIFEEERWHRAEENLAAVLARKLDLAAVVRIEKPVKKDQVSFRPNKVVVDNDSSSFFTIVEVFSYDFPGLLYRVTDVLAQCGMDIWVAKIATKVDQVVDVFYVRDSQGRKVGRRRAEEIESRLLAVLPDPDETPV
ncbi:MAG: [protein-PII] uridylyltransferase, partial [Thermodesulfobacteriota bacterium]